jgi:hypothetical protein
MARLLQEQEYRCLHRPPPPVAVRLTNIFLTTSVSFCTACGIFKF